MRLMPHESRDDDDARSHRVDQTREAAGVVAALSVAAATTELYSPLERLDHGTLVGEARCSRYVGMKYGMYP